MATRNPLGQILEQTLARPRDEETLQDSEWPAQLPPTFAHYQRRSAVVVP